MEYIHGYLVGYRTKDFQDAGEQAPAFTTTTRRWLKVSHRHSDLAYQLLADAQTQRGDPFERHAATEREVRDHVKHLLPHLTGDKKDIRLALVQIQYPAPDMARDDIQVYSVLAYFDVKTGRTLFFHIRGP
jgi:hypothetical protein